ncbi:hypothetical protein LCGC14_0395190 [marine sediment metagenome]|uniref:Uncharacterized protein n=1 Tax=marine sediment metagenome TaxID=412755 RepID=A0A0F9T433_9ZZZZ
MSSNGGGSVSGAISHQATLLAFVEEMLNDKTADSLDNSIVDLVNAAHTTNPYDAVTSFNPNTALTLIADSPLTRMNEQYAAAKTLVDGIVEETDWASYVVAAVAKFTSYEDIDFLDNLDTAIAGLLVSVESALSSSSITSMVTAFENNKKTRFLRDVGLWSGGMADINAVHTSSFIIGLALQQIEFSNSVDQYERELKGNIYMKLVTSGIDAHVKAHVVQLNNKDNLITQAPSLMASLNQLKTQLVTDLAKIKVDVERMTIIAKKEQEDRQVAIDVDEALWDMEAMLYAGNILSSITGSTTGRQIPQTPSTAQSVLGGALTGASIGSKFGVPGVIAGATAGAVLGWAL